MTDAAYLFRKTSSERKRNGWGAYNKKGGRRKCSLPSDNLTAKQRKELNGVVETINTMEKLSYAEYKKLSKSMKEQYLTALFSIHNARVTDIAEMWGRADQNLRRSFNEEGIDISKLAHLSSAFKKKSPSHDWEVFLSNSYAKVSPPVEEPKAPPEAPSAVKLDDPDELDVPELVKGKLEDDVLLRVVSGTLNYEGDPYAIFEKVMLAIDPSKKYKVQVRFQACDY